MRFPLHHSMIQSSPEKAEAHASAFLLAKPGLSGIHAFSPLRGEKVAEGRMRGALRTAQTSRAWQPIVNTRIDGLRLRTQQQKRCGSER